MLKKFFEKKEPPTVTRSDPDFRTPLPDFKGKRRDPMGMTGSLPSSKRTDEARFRTGPIHKLHPRDVRARTWLSLFGYLGWYVGVFCFIAYRLSSDDLDLLEKEARQQAELKKKIEKEFSN